MQIPAIVPASKGKHAMYLAGVANLSQPCLQYTSDKHSRYDNHAIWPKSIKCTQGTRIEVCY